MGDSEIVEIRDEFSSLAESKPAVELKSVS